MLSRYRFIFGLPLCGSLPIKLRLAELLLAGLLLASLLLDGRLLLGEGLLGSLGLVGIKLFFEEPFFLLFGRVCRNGLL